MLQKEVNFDPTVAWLVNQSRREPIFEPCWCIKGHKFPWLRRYKKKLLSLLTCHLPRVICKYTIWGFVMDHPKCFESAQEIFPIMNPQWQLPECKKFKEAFGTNGNIGIFSNAMDPLLRFMLYAFDPLVSVFKGSPEEVDLLDIFPTCFYIHDDDQKSGDNQGDRIDPAEVFVKRHSWLTQTFAATNKYPPGWQGFDDLLIHGTQSLQKRKREHLHLMSNVHYKYGNWVLNPARDFAWFVLDYIIVYQCKDFDQGWAFQKCLSYLSREDLETLLSDKTKAHVMYLRGSAPYRSWSFEVPSILPPFRLNRGSMWKLVCETSPPLQLNYSKAFRDFP